MRYMLTLPAITLLMSAAVYSQAPPPPPPPPLPPGPSAGGDVFFYQPAEKLRTFRRDAKPVTNAPYQADMANETVQHLADGNVIQNSHTSKTARDSQGRTWTEETVEKMGPWSTDSGPKTIIFISDPVAGYSYVLHPDTKKVERLPLRERPFEAHIAGPGPIGLSTVVTGPGSQERIRTFGPKEQGTEQKEDLGTKQVNGVQAHGQRVTGTIPANTIGNQQPIVTVTESWYSPDLQMIVSSTRTDPRFGETTFQLKNIQRTEPSADLFQVPSDYTVGDGARTVIELKQ